MPMEEADGGGVTAPKAASLVWGMPAGQPLTAFPHAQNRQNSKTRGKE